MNGETEWTHYFGNERDEGEGIKCYCTHVCEGHSYQLDAALNEKLKKFLFPFESSQTEFYTYLRGMKSKVIEDVNIVSVAGL